MASHKFSWILVCLAVLLAWPELAARARAADPTDGFTAVSLREKNFMLQWPYVQPRSRRYSFDGTERRLWVFSADKPYSFFSSTNPRTEMRMTGYDYSSGVWQFEGNCFVPSGTSGVSIMQVFGASPTATTLMLHVYNGQLWYYHNRVVENGIYDRWFRLNVIHNVASSRLTVFVDGVSKLSVPGKGGNGHYFKFGVYMQGEASRRMESRWKGVRILTKN